MRRLSALILFLLIALIACTGPQALDAIQPGATLLPATVRPLPTFSPYQTRTPTSIPRSTDTPTPFAPPFQLDTATPTIVTQGSSSNPIGPQGAAPVSPSSIARSSAPSIIQQALIAAGVADPKVYWFTFDEGDHEQALMIQYLSPLAWYDSYQPMLRATKLIAARYYLQIEPTLYSLFIAATDLTGQSTASLRLRRSSVAKWTTGQIGTDDLVNNYFENTQPVLTCTLDGCTAKMATPFVFHFPAGFPTPPP
jgi:hypothetical protein